MAAVAVEFCWRHTGYQSYTNKILKLDGRLPHEVMAFTGRRYCIIWYKVFDRNMKKPASVFEPARIVYE